MEDNEFEEVTIISHTDHGTSVLPQSTAERLMKEIKLEVTQKISQNENVKLGSLQHSTTPTLLDSIQLYVQQQPRIRGGLQFWIDSSFSRSASLSKEYLAIEKTLYELDRTTHKLNPIYTHQ